MISVNMHEAKTRLSELVKTVETTGELIVLCRDGEEVAEIRRRTARRGSRRDLAPDPTLKVKLTRGYLPTEPLTAGEWPADLR